MTNYKRGLKTAAIIGGASYIATMASVCIWVWFGAYMHNDSTLVTINKFSERNPELVLNIVGIALALYTLYAAMEWWMRHERLNDQ